MLGSLGWQTYDNYPLDSRAGLSVDVADGNLLVTSDDLDIAGEEIPFDVTRYYNSLATATGSVGYGSTLGMGPDVHVTANTDGSATLAGPSGYQVLFAPSDGAAGGYDISPALTSASLASVSGGGWTLTDHTSGEVLTFNSAGNEVSDAAASGETVSYAYTSGTSNLASVTDTEGRVTTFSDYTGNLVGEITDPSGRTVRYTYSGSELTGVVDAAGDTWSYGYTGGLLTSVTDPNGKQTTIGYNAAGEVSSVTLGAGTADQGVWGYTYQPGSTSVTSPLGGTTTYEWDGAGRVQTTIDPMGNSTNTSYDDDNNVITSSDPSGNVTDFGFSSSDEPSSVELPTTSTGAAGAVSTAKYPSSTSQYLPASTTDAQGNTTTLSYDAFNNPTKSVNPSATSLASYQGDGSTSCGAPQGEICASTSPNGYVTAYAYSGGNLTKVTPPGPLGATSYSYDGLSRVVSTTDGNGNVVKTSYDADDRVKTDGGISYTYDKDGNLLTETGPSGTTTYTYNGRSEVTSITPPGQAKLSYTYDGAGDILTEAGSGDTNTYTYDKAGEVLSLQKATAGSTSTETFGYANGLLASLTLPGGQVVETFAYDTADRVTSAIADYTNSQNGAVTDLLNQSGTYTSSTGASTMLLQSVNDNLGRTDTTYGYDALNRVTSSSGPGNTYGYTYDADGDITQGTHNNTTAGGSFNADDEISIDTYDADGNETRTPQSLAAGYNALDETTSFTPSGGSPIAQAYEGATQSGRITDGGTSQQDGQLGIFSDTTSGSSEWYGNLPGGRTVSETGTSDAGYFYLFDIRGSVADVVDSNGDIADSYTYDPYGNLITSSGGIPNPYRYDDGYYDTATGLYHFGDRYYNPADGRWTQLDPTGQSAGYVYADDDPVNESDPTGDGTYSLILKTPDEVLAAAAGIRTALLAGDAIPPPFDGISLLADAYAESFLEALNDCISDPRLGRGLWCEITVFTFWHIPLYGTGELIQRPPRPKPGRYTPPKNRR